MIGLPENVPSRDSSILSQGQNKLFAFQSWVIAAVSSFALATGGNTAMMYAVSLIPAVGAAGTAIDMGRAVVVRKRLESALDAAALSVANQSGLTPQQLQSQVQTFFDANFPDKALGDAKVVASASGELTLLRASASVPTSIMGIFGIEELEVAVEVEAVRANKGLEMVLALDNTGSMSESGKLAALKSSMTDLINILFGDNSNPAHLKMGLVPFSETVRLNPTQALQGGWIDVNGVSPWARLNFNNNMHPMSVWGTMRNSAWSGCVEARPNGLEETDEAPSSANPGSLFVPFFQPDEPDKGNYANNYLADGVAGGTQDADAMRNSAKYVNRTSNRPNSECTIKNVVPLTNDKAALLSHVNAMQASGYTHINLGASWGWRVISPGAPFQEGASYEDKEWKKSFVLLSDGVNTIPGRSSALGSDYTAYGYLSQARLGTQSRTQAQRNLDARTLQVCSRMKALGIRVYTILLMENDPATVNLMRSCATSPELFFESPSGAELRGVFQTIANDLTNLRLTR
jgi:Flp pilus assembly protein TadG